MASRVERASCGGGGAGEILWVSPEARAAGVLPGMRYAEGLSLATSLRASEVPAGKVRAEITGLADLLRRFSPDVEVSEEEPGVFWVNAAGLLELFSSLDLWVHKVHRALIGGGWRASVVVGFRRFAVYAVARGREGVLVLASPDEEEAALQKVHLSILAVDPHLRDTLAKLGIHTLGEFMRLPAPAVRRRFGDEAARLHALAQGEVFDPLAPVFPAESIACTIVLDAPEGNSVRLLFVIQEHLHSLLPRLAEQGEALRELEIRFLLERQKDRTDRIRPAEATLDETLILDLLRLRLEGFPLTAPAREIGLTAHGAPASTGQVRLFLKAPRRDLAAANRALARIRAELGEETVVRAKLLEGHLPEERFTWEPLLHLPKAHPDPEGRPVLVRRLCSWHASLGRPQRGRVVRACGPYILSDGWWQTPGGYPIHRRYYFLETLGGALLWVYYDSLRQRWFLQGQVE
ncbi:MAG: DNA polymerase IV [Syntrophorhabdus sp. PtaB.Bin184]|nr:MAG: DNA polymerase IV [Syntrophorhabdus sp. PtaB.Bin184]